MFLKKFKIANSSINKKQKDPANETQRYLFLRNYYPDFLKQWANVISKAKSSEFVQA